MEQIPNFDEIAESIEDAYKIIQNFKNGEYANPNDPNMCRIALRGVRSLCRDALAVADASQSQLGEV